MMNRVTVLVVDKREPRRKSIVATILRCAPPNKTIVHEHAAESGEWMPEIGNDLVPNLVLFHLGDRDRLEDEEEIREPVNRASTFILYAGAGIGRDTDVPEGWLSIPRPLGRAEDLSEGEWRELLYWAAETDPNRTMDPELLPRALRADFPRFATALLVLCQGYLAMTGGQVKGAAEGANRVSTRAWWGEPFLPTANVEDPLKRELGIPHDKELDPNLLALIRWFRWKPEHGPSDPQCDLQGPGLRDLVIKVEILLAKELGACTMSA